MKASELKIGNRYCVDVYGRIGIFTGFSNLESIPCVKFKDVSKPHNYELINEECYFAIDDSFDFIELPHYELGKWPIDLERILTISKTGYQIGDVVIDNNNKAKFIYGGLSKHGEVKFIIGWTEEEDWVFPDDSTFMHDSLHSMEKYDHIATPEEKHQFYKDLLMFGYFWDTRTNTLEKF